MNAPSDLKPSRFTLSARRADGDLLLFNSFTTSLLRIDACASDDVGQLLSTTSREQFEARLAQVDDGTCATLVREGMLVSRAADESFRAQAVHEALGAPEALHLILMPTEQCNFRCVYCYEDFRLGRMPADVTEGVARLIEREAPTLRRLDVGWFGGEPLAALDQLEQISVRALRACAEHDVAYRANITTNGYLLDARRRQRCYAAGISAFQVTVDGPPEAHDQLRVRADGRGTFARIYGHLTEMRDDDAEFRVNLRVNYTPDSLPLMPDFIAMLGRDFAGDDRFQLHVHPVGRWGGPNDDQLNVCDGPSASAEEIRLMSLALDAGFGLEAWRSMLKPHGSVCYAANPRSFVIGSDGTVYKCTVAFRDERNHVGTITRDGELQVDPGLMRLWTTSGEETDTGCQSCAFRPACQGNLCPLERMNRDGARVCPPFKVHHSEHLSLLAREAERSLVS